MENLFYKDYKIKTNAHEILTNKKNKKFILSFKDRLARSLVSVINILDPEIIVFGGGLSNEIKDLNEIKKFCEKYLEVKSLNTVFSHPAHGDSSGVRGAAILSR